MTRLAEESGICQLLSIFLIRSSRQSETFDKKEKRNKRASDDVRSGIWRSGRKRLDSVGYITSHHCPILRNDKTLWKGKIGGNGWIVRRSGSRENMRDEVCLMRQERTRIRETRRDTVQTGGAVLLFQHVVTVCGRSLRKMTWRNEIKDSDMLLVVVFSDRDSASDSGRKGVPRKTKPRKSTKTDN